MAEPSSRRYAHSEGITHFCFDSKRHLVTCGHDCDVRLFVDIEDSDCPEFRVHSDKITALACYSRAGRDVVAIATDDNTVQAYTTEGSPEGLLTRFTSPITYLAVSSDHTLLAAGSAEFSIKIVDLGELSRVTTLLGHEAPVLCVRFDPRGEYLATSSCDGTVKIWSLKSNECVKTLPILQKSNDVSMAKSLTYLSWQPKDGKVLAVPTGSEVSVFDRSSWKNVCSLNDDHHKENVNVVSWSPCGRYLASGGVDGCVVSWEYTSKKACQRFKNENGTGITSLEWDPRGMESDQGNVLVFADREGYVGVFEGVYPAPRENGGTFASADDPLADDSLLMEGIPADEIFKDDFDIDDNDVMGDDITTGGHHGNQDEGEDPDDEIVQSRKRRRLEGDASDQEVASDLVDDYSNLSDGRLSLPRQPEPTLQSAPKKVPAFSEKLVEVYQGSFQPSATPDHLQHRFMVYNLVGVVRSHSDSEAAMIEVEFHNTSTHHAFSLPNHLEFNMAALNEQALVLACGRNEDSPSQLHCVHFSSWDSNKDWSTSLPSKESITAVAVGDGWIATATSKQHLRLFTISGVQREIISIPGAVVTLTGWGGRLALVYQSGPSTENVFTQTVWVLDVRRRRQLHPPHPLPLSHHTKLEWIGFSEEGLLVSYDTKGIVRILSPSYGGLSWLPVLNTTKHVGNKSDHYFIVGMTHRPNELRGILCKGLEYPPVHPKPVMSSLALKLPLCEMNTEKAELEEQYLQMDLSGEENDTSRAQQLMKMFALACKSDREFRAWEIAGMMPNEHSMNLALTYASRTQHHRLARHIGDLIQQKSLEDFESDNEMEDYYETTETTNQIADDEREHQYVRSRNEKLNVHSQSISTKRFTTAGGSRSKFGTSKTLAKFDRYMEEIRQGKFLSSSRKPEMAESQESYASEDRFDVSEDRFDVNETKELFSDSEEEGALNGEAADTEDGVAIDTESVGSDIRPDTPPEPVLESAGTKRPNPFKIATPTSKRLQAERRSSFLDNISARIEEEGKRKQERKSGGGRGEATARSDKGTRKTAKVGAVPKKASGVQSSLKTSFFKKKELPLQKDGEHEDHEMTTENKPTEDNGESGADNSGCVTENDQQLSSKDKLALFAFKSH